MRRLAPGLSLTLVLLCVNATIAGPISEYYITAGDQRMIHVIQGSSVSRSWSGTGLYEYPVAVLNGTVRTSAYSAGGTGAEYTAAGVATGTTYAYPGTIRGFFDSTTDGSYNYGYDYSAGGMYRMDLDWQNPTLLFGGPTGNLAVTYDRTNNSLWVANWWGSTIANLDMSGNPLSSFSTGISEMTGLALDPADGTLWFGTQNDLWSTRTLYQYSKAGAALSIEAYAALSNQNYLGGEFNFVSAVPEPTTLAIWSALGGLGMMVAARRRRRVA